jgi:nucleoside-diphosphate-sugar epimerase
MDKDCMDEYEVGREQLSEARHIVITGGAGYIGSLLTGSLLRRGDWVTVVDDLLFGGESILAYLSHARFHFMRADVCEAGILSQAACETESRGAPPFSAIVHLAAIVGFPACKHFGREAAWRTNVHATQKLFEDANNLGVERFIFSSTYSVYGVAEGGELVTEEARLSPQSLYAETKIAAEDFLVEASQSAHCAPMIYRFATLYGASPRMRFDLIINQFVLEAFTRGELVIFQRGYSRSFVHIRDVVEGLVLGVEAPEELIRGQIYNLGDEDGNYTKDEIVALIMREIPETRVQYKDLAFGGDMRDVKVSYRKIQQQLGFRAQWTAEKGIQEILYLLQTGFITDPFCERYRNAEFIVQ